MGFTKESATERAKQDLADRLKTDLASINELSIEEKDFPDMSLGAPEPGEMAAQMISTGWQINLGTEGNTYDYRADKYQLRLADWGGRNHLIE